MRLGPPLSRQGHSTIAHRFIGGFRHASRMQTREGRQKTTPLREVSSDNLKASHETLPSLTGLIGTAALTPTVKTVGYYRASLAGQSTDNPELRRLPC